MVQGMSEELDAAERAAKANREARPVSLEGETVVRPAATNAATIHDFLHHLRGEGILGVPELLHLGEGTETLRLIVGDSGGDCWKHQHTDEGLASAARFLRRIHDASTSWTPPPDAEWGAPAERATNGEELVFCHGDPGPWNFVWQDKHAVGLIDWDFLHPAPRVSDVAYALQWFVPLRRDEHALEWHHFPEVPDRRHRVQVFLDAYGDLPPFDVAEAVANRMQDVSDLVQSLAEAGHEPQRTWVADGALEVDAEEIAWVREHRSEFR
jgi:aminoglycoside phosphotransferase (APT) family kinase protein